jgi:integrase
MYARGGYFWISYYKPGQKNDVRRSTNIALDIPAPGKRPAADWWKKSKRRKELQVIYDDVLFERSAESRGIEVLERSDLPATIEDLLSEFTTESLDTKDRPRAKNTLVHRRHAIALLNKYLKGRPWYAIDQKWVVDFRDAAKKEYSDTSLRGYFIVLRMLYRYAADKGYIERSPFARVVVSVEKKDIQHLTRDQEYELFTWLWQNDRPIFHQLLFQRLTGLRVSEVCALTWDSVKGDLLHYYNSKAHRWEDMPLSKAALQVLPVKNGDRIFHYANKRSVIKRLELMKKAVRLDVHTHIMKEGFLREVAATAPDARTFDALAHHAPTVNKLAVEHYSGRVIKLMREAVDKAHTHWISFLIRLAGSE